MKETHGYILIIGASVIWGTMGIFGKLAFEYGINPTTLITLRLMISSLTILAPLALFKRVVLRIERSYLLQFLLLGVLGTAFQRIAYFYAVDLTTVTMAAILFFTYPILVTIYTVLFIKKRIASSTILSIVLALSGVALVVRAYDVSELNASFPGVISGLFSSIFFVFYFLITKRLRQRYANWTLIFYGDGIGALFLAPLVLFSFSKVMNYPLQLWLLILAIAWFPSLLAYLMFSHALKEVEPAKGSVLGVLEPLSASFFSATILGEGFEPLQILGVSLAVAGVAILFYKSRHL